MAIMSIQRCTCDLCKKTIEFEPYKSYVDKLSWFVTEIENGVSKKKQIEPWKKLSVTVKFMTEQNEGTTCAPYFDNETIDICPECYIKLLDKWPIKAHGAQGYNSYELVE